MRRDYTQKKAYRHMTQEKAEEIRRLYFSREASQKELAHRFKLSQAAVSRIISGWTWRAV